MAVIIRIVIVFVFLVWAPSSGIRAEKHTESFWDKIIRIVGISATPSAVKGSGDGVEEGDIWVVSPEQSVSRRLTWGGGYRSPVFEPTNDTVLALNGNTIFRIPLAEGEPEALFSLEGLVKLVGFSTVNPENVLIVKETDVGLIGAGLLSLITRKVAIHVPKSREERRLLVHLKGWRRVYGDTVLYVKRETKDTMSGAIQWDDVYIKQGGESPANLSRCDGINCGQPSLSSDGRKVVYVKKEL
jgi:hypothetical protein